MERFKVLDISGDVGIKAFGKSIDEAFINAAIVVPAQAGATRALVEFGYAEEGTITNYYCTSRAEKCQVSRLYASGVDLTTPFKWASESITSVACAPGCVLGVPALPGRVAFYRVKYRNDSESEVATGASGVIIDGTVVKAR